jgi:phosphatidylinositol alpha-1,6-mannosyltransferase
VHAGRALPEGVGALAAKTLHGIPYLVWVHGEELATAASSRELTWLTRRVHQNAAMLLTSSNNTKQLLAARGVTPSKISVAHPGVDTDRFSPRVDGASIRQRYAPGGERLLLTVGRLQRRKGHDLTIDAIARLVEKQRNVKYLIVGDGEERPALEQRVAKHGLSNHVMFAGIVPAGALPSYYAACDVFLMPNRIDAGDFEGFGIVFLEAAACGKPTIGGKSGGASEAVQDGETGMLVSGTDVDELAGAIDRLISSAELRSRFGGAGRERVLRQFTWNHTAAVVAEAQRRIRG